MRKLLMAAALSLTTLSISPAALANHGTDEWNCYSVDVYRGSTVEWYSADYGWETEYYDNYWECSDGHWYEYTFRYSWTRGQGYYVA